MTITKGYTQINNTLLLALLELPKGQRLVFGCLRINSDYTNHVSNPMSVKNIVEFTGLKRQNINNDLKTLEETGWIAKVTQAGYTYQWELSIAKLTNEEVHTFLYPSEPDTQTELNFDANLEPEPTTEPDTVHRYKVETIDGKQVKTLTLGPYAYRFNQAISDFQIKPLWKNDDAWEMANGHTKHLSDTDIFELHAQPYSPDI